MFREKSKIYQDALADEMRTLLRATAEDGKPDNLFGMMQYQMGWVDADFRPIRVYAGKQIRPLLTLLVCEAAGGDWRHALPAAAAVEVLHNFSLVHDDIEDGSPTRRGRETVWRVWGEAQAINAGDAMFATAQLALTRLLDVGVAAETVVQAIRRLNETCIELTQGQATDMRFEAQEEVSAAEYIEMITGKTAVLIALSCELGARVAEADEETVANYAAYGRDLGLAFQVIDDILGVWGNETLIGKSAESDILTKKKTLPILYGLERSADLRVHFQQPATNLNFVLDAVAHLDKAEARQFAEAEANRRSESAVGHLRAANPQGDAALALDELTAMLLQRDS